jgi:hypothetical protein
MNEIVNAGGSTPVEAALPLIELGKWMGRRDAFGQMAGRCSAAEIESLRRIHDGKLYQGLNCTWEQFCAEHLKVSARTVERELAHLRRFGPAFFTLRQLARISAREYAAIADCVSAQGVHVNGEVIGLDPENSDGVAGAVQALLEQKQPAGAVAAPVTFDAAMQRFRTASESLRSFDKGLDTRRAKAVALELAKLLAAAAGWGVEIRIS